MKIIKKRADLVLDILLLVALISVTLIYEPLNRPRLPLHSLRTPLDASIPLVAVFVLPYLSLFALIAFSLLFTYLRHRRLFRQTIITMITVQLLSYAVFWLWQTQVARPHITQTDIFSRLVAWTYAHDAPYSGFPSLHVSLSLTCAIAWLKLHSRASPVIVVWSVLVAVSTVFVKQHYVADVLGGAFLAAGCFIAVSSIRPHVRNHASAGDSSP